MALSEIEVGLANEALFNEAPPAVTV